MKKDKVFVAGSSGMVGSRFVEIFSNDYDFLTPSSEELNILDLYSLKKYFLENAFSCVVNFAAFTDVSAAESQRDDKNGDCYKVNLLGVKNLVELCKKHGVFFVQISTDMVFPGSSQWPGPYGEKERPEADSNKLNWYGFTKAEAEMVVLEFNYSSILRINYPVRANYPPKSDFLRKSLELFDADKLYPLFYDQQISVSFIDEAVEAVNLILKKREKGVFHASSTNTTSPFEVTSYFIKSVRGQRAVVNKSSLSEFIRSGGSPLRYPQWGGLKVNETQKKLGIKFSSWKEVVNKIVNQQKMKSG